MFFVIFTILILFLTWLYLKHYNNFKNGGLLVAKVLKSHQISFVFTLTGGHISPILSECKKLDIKVIDTRNEATAAFAADGVSRLSNQIGVCIVTAGPGVTNTITAVRNAQMAESPMLLIGGAAATLLKGKGSLQDVEQLELLKPVCKKVYRCCRLEQIENTIKNAIYIAKEGVPGPVFVEIPIDLLYEKNIVIKNSGLEKVKKNIMSRLIDYYIKLRIDYLFSKSYFYNFINQPLKVKDKQINLNYITQSKKLISESKKPVCVIGSQVVNCKEKINDFIISFKKLGIPVYLSSSARGLFSDKYKLQFYHNRSKALREADLILLLGITCDFRLNYGKVLNKNAKIISVNICKKSLYLNQSVFWNSTLSIHNCPSEFITSLDLKYDPFDLKIYDDWINTLQLREEQRNTEIIKLSKPDNLKIRINPIRLCMEINKLIDKKSIIIVDGGDFAATAAYTIKPKGPLQWMDPGPFGTLGVGAGFALAAKLCYPDYEVYIIYGDGAAGYSLVEYDTFKRHNLNIVSIIGNDACWSQILREQIEILKDDVACKLEYSDYQLIGDAFDCKGYILKNDDDLKKLYDILSNINQPMIINCLISKTDFRKGSISV